MGNFQLQGITYFWMPGNRNIAAGGNSADRDLAGLAEVLTQPDCLRVHVGKNKALVAINLRRLDQAPIFTVKLLMVDLFEAGHAN